MSETPTRVAVVGTGMGAGPHLQSLADLAPQVDLAWICARDPARLEALALPAALAGARRTTRLEDILGDASVAAVLVLTPPHAHLDVARRVAQAGKHVLVEKPLEIDLDGARALVECCERAGVALAVMLQHRLRAGAAALSERLRAGELGELVCANLSVRWWRPQSYYDVPGRGTRARDGGGVLMTQAIHTLDLLLSLIGLPERVSGAVATSSVHRMECEDTASALLHYAGGAVAVVQATTAAHPGYPERIELDFAHGTATLVSGELRLVMRDGRILTEGESVGSGGGADPMRFDHGPHRAVIEDFIRAVRTGTAPAVTGRSALGVHRVIDAILQSSARGASVALAPEPAARATGATA